jgi:preprotein translocase subunit SecD
MSTLITSFLIIVWFDSSFVKGFAITLIIGVLVSMFSSIVITRMWIELIGKIKWLSNKKWIWGA